MLNVEGLGTGYNNICVLREVSLKVEQGEIVTLIGANGAGKTTLMRTVAGLHPPTAGRISFMGQNITGIGAHKIVKRGLSLVPEGRQLFSSHTVLDNLLLGTLGQATKPERKQVEARIEEMMTIFPRLRERAGQLAGTLSGGEQQMLAIARGLMSNPRFLLLDEPSLGLAPLLVEEIFALIKKLNADGVSVFLVEQNAFAALGISHRGYVLENGRVVKEGKASDLIADKDIHYHYLGGKAV